MITLLTVLTIWFLAAFFAGVVLAPRVNVVSAAGVELGKTFVSSVVESISAGAVNLVDHFNAWIECFFCLVLPAGVELCRVTYTRLAAGAAARVELCKRFWYILPAGAAAGVELVRMLAARVVELVTYELADTTRSIYALSVDIDSIEHPAGEYLIRDNGAWKNVFLTSHARRLMGDSAEVIALSPAIVHDSHGVSKVWHVAIA